MGANTGTSKERRKELAFSVIKDKAFSELTEPQLQRFMSLFDHDKLVSTVTMVYTVQLFLCWTTYILIISDI